MGVAYLLSRNSALGHQFVSGIFLSAGNIDATVHREILSYENNRHNILLFLLALPPNKIGVHVLRAFYTLCGNHFHVLSHLILT